MFALSWRSTHEILAAIASAMCLNGTAVAVTEHESVFQVNIPENVLRSLHMFEIDVILCWQVLTHVDTISMMILYTIHFDGS